MLKLSCAAWAAAGLIALSGCSSSASDPAVAGAPAGPPQSSAAPAAAAPAAASAASAVASVESGGLGSAPPSFAPVGPIPGPRIAGDNPATTVENPYANNPSALEQGRRIFVQMNCAGCHGGHAGGGMGPDLRPDHIFAFGNTPAELFDSISEGRGMGMPAWGMKLPPDVIWKLVAYIQSLGTAQEPSQAAPAPVRAPDSVATPAY
ncbi:MAG: cytochrome c [Proteobacteria bacterium]|nr:cytochrome c [Pseudomonadota bacterium]